MAVMPIPIAPDVNPLYASKYKTAFSPPLKTNTSLNTDNLENADLTICNLEGALTDNPERCNKIGPVIIAPTNTVEAYKRLGIDCCMLANNHITDGGHQGVVDTIRTLNNANIKYVGAGVNEDQIERSIVYDLGNIKIGLYNVCELMYNRPAHNKGGAWLYDEYVVCKEIADLKTTIAEVSDDSFSV